MYGSLPVTLTQDAGIVIFRVYFCVYARRPSLINIKKPRKGVRASMEPQCEHSQGIISMDTDPFDSGSDEMLQIFRLPVYLRAPYTGQRRNGSRSIEEVDETR